MRKIFKIFSFFVLCLFIFCGCVKSNPDINSTLSDTDVENLLNVYHKGGILQRICSINDLDENDLIQFYYYTNEDKLSNTQDYKLNLSDFKNYISNYFDISKFDFGKSYYYRAENDVIDLSDCLNLERLSTDFKADKYQISDNTLEIFYYLDFLIGDEKIEQYKILSLVYNEDTESYVFKSVANSKLDGREKFMAMANHDNYIIGKVVDSYTVQNRNDLSDSYVTVISDGVEYRIEGLCWGLNHTQTPFSISTWEYLYESYPKGEPALIFFDKDRLNQNVIRPKDICIGQHPTGVSMDDLAIGIQKISQRLIDNYNAVSNPAVYSPEEAIWTYISLNGYSEPIKAEKDEYGSIYYVCGDYCLKYEGVLFNEYFGMTDEEIIEYYQDAHFGYPDDPDKIIENIRERHIDKYPPSEPMIEYIISVTKTNGDIVDFCLVNIYGKIS